MNAAGPFSPDGGRPDDDAASPPAARGTTSSELLTGQAREEHLFREVMDASRQEEASLNDMYCTTVRLSAPVDPPDMAALRERCARQFEADLKRAVDAGGNPSWISLTLPERRDPDGISVPEDSLLEQDKAARAAKEKTAADRKKKDADADSPQRTGVLGVLFGPKAPSASGRPRGAVLRMFLIGGALAVLYHILVFFGIVPKMF